jgi:putative membrane protein
MAHMEGTCMNMMAWMWIPWLLVLAALVGLGVWAALRSSGRGRGSTSRRILEERFARGEIDIEEFRSRLAALEEHR